MTQPPDDAALVARLKAYRPTDEWGDGVHHVICTEAATALEAKDQEIARLHAGFRGRINAGLIAFCAETPDFDMSSSMRRTAADFIIGQPFSREAARAALEPSDKGVGR